MNKQQKKALIRQTSQEGMVLLKNRNNTLPLKAGTRVAAFGSTFYFCFKGGAGSGDILGVFPVQPIDGLRNTDVVVDESVAEFYENFNAARFNPQLINWNRYNCRWKNSLEEPSISDELIDSAAETNDIAIINIARSSGEWFDVPLEKGGFYLTDTEISLIERVRKSFKKVILLLNTYGVIDVEFMEKYDFDAILYTSMGGSEMGNAVADILTGAVSPSGKLASTWAPIDTYPTHENFQELYIPYNEGIYVGYRYYDSFGIAPAYPFGFGLSYTNFEINLKECSIDNTAVTVCAEVKNIGETCGKEVVQLYLSEPVGRLNKAYQQLVAFVKTKELKAGEMQRVELNFDLRDFAAYCEETAEYVLEKGTYTLRLGKSSRNTKICGRIALDNDAVTLKTRNCCVPEKPLDLILPRSMDNQSGEEYENCAKLRLSAGNIETVTVQEVEEPRELVAKEFYTLEDVRNGKCSVEDFVANFTDEQLADVLNGKTGKTINPNPNLGTMSVTVNGAAGETWSNDDLKIPPCVNADGPTGIRLGHFIDERNPIPYLDTEMSLSMSAFPTATCLANTWNVALPRLMGEVVSDDMSRAGLGGWLAPAMNIHRNPLCGRNFEYFSEDPVISGEMAAASTMGIQLKPDGPPSGHYATIKHFAANNAEKHRFDSDSVMSERALREIYIRGFEIAVKKAKPLALMNSYNKINGVYASDSYDLNISILRGEWGFEGCVMTDWCSKSSAFKMPNAGCDLVMPGCKNQEYFEGLQDGRINRAKAQRCAVNIMTLVLKTTK